MSDGAPEQPTTSPAVPDGPSSEPPGEGGGTPAAGPSPDETVTAPAGAAPPMPEMRTPKHGRGKLLVAGKPEVGHKIEAVVDRRHGNWRSYHG